LCFSLDYRLYAPPSELIFYIRGTVAYGLVPNRRSTCANLSPDRPRAAARWSTDGSVCYRTSSTTLCVGGPDPREGVIGLRDGRRP